MVQEPDGDRILFEGYVQPGCGPILRPSSAEEGFEVKQESWHTKLQALICIIFKWEKARFREVSPTQVLEF